MRRLLLLLMCAGAPVYAQDVALPEVVGPGEKQPGETTEMALDINREIDLANVVTSAAKGVTTVQEAPAIITVLTSEEIRSRGFKWLDEALATVPGWQPAVALGQQVPQLLVRGVGQGQLLLHDGISMFDPWVNISPFGRAIPLESLKRVEVVTGPGGVLWGANSFMGIINMISKDAEDVNGIEVGGGYGDGRGNRQDGRVWAMFGKSFFKNRLKIFQHVSFETYIGQINDLPTLLGHSPAPQPAGPSFYGPNDSGFPPRSWIAYIDGKYSFGPLTFYYAVPFGEMYHQMTFNNAPVRRDQLTVLDRYAILEYKGRYWKDRIGLTAKGYYVESVRTFEFNLFSPSTLFPPFTNSQGKMDPGGLFFREMGLKGERTGLTVDADFNLPGNIRLLAGGEFFYERVPTVDARFISPENPGLLPLYCPVDATGVGLSACPRSFQTSLSRYVTAGYVDATWRIWKLIFDGGVRLQKGFGERSYEFVPLYSGAIVYNFLPDLHFKANYTTGFRPPVAQYTEGVQGGLNYGANRHLRNERSQAFQGELNARLLRNVKRIRQLELRLDYSYTALRDTIQLSRGATWTNTGVRSIHAVEAYAKLYLQGDHFLQASYTFLHSTTADRGQWRATPNHFFIVGAVFNLIKHRWDINANLAIHGAYEDFNRYPSGPGVPPDSTSAAKPTDLVIDRLTPVANLHLGTRVRFLDEKMQISLQFYNVLDQRYWSSDIFNDLTPTVEMAPTPLPGFNFWGSVSYRFGL